jgi:hypothetical protein
MKKIILPLTLLLLLPLVFAHQPKFVNQEVEINDPEISRAFYGILEGEPHTFTINSQEEFDLYVQILAPDIENTRTDFNVEIIHPDNTITLLNGSQTEWQTFFEEFARDSYLEGPQLKQQSSPAGQYKITVFNQDNQGKYSLAIGETESFTPKETIDALLQLPKVKKEIFEKPAITAFFNPFGLIILIPILIILTIITITIIYVKKRK